MPYKDPEQRRATHRAYADRNRRLIQAAKEKPCTDCGVQYPFYVMQLDHLRDKLFEFGRSNTRSVKNILNEIAKCEPVCANCHAERTYRRAHPVIP